MGFVGNVDRSGWFGCALLTAIFVFLDYAFHYLGVGYGYAIPESLSYTYFFPKVFLIPAFWLVINYGSKIPFLTVTKDVQIAALLALALSLRYFLLGAFSYEIQVAFAIAHFAGLYTSLKLYEVIV